MKELALLFGMQFMSYLNVTLDMRAVAHQQYWLAALTNLVQPAISWMMIRAVAKSERGWLGALAIAFGGALSTLFGMWLTRRW